MALIKCDECGSKISSKSLFCPHCGYPTHLNAAHPDGIEPEAFAALKKAVGTLVYEEQKPQPAKEDDVTPSAPKPEHHETTEATEALKALEASEAPEIPETPETSDEPEPSHISEPEPSEEDELEREARARRRNERTKVLLFLGVFLTLLGVVLYFYFTSPLEKAGDEILEEDIETVDSLMQSAEVTPSDSVATPTADTIKANTPPAPTPKPAAKPAAKPAPTHTPAEPEHEIKVAPLSQQASHTTEVNTETPSQQ